MLTEDDKDKIIKLKSKRFSYQAIKDRLGFSIDTIAKVVKEEKIEKKWKKRKLKEKVKKPKKIR